MSDLFKMGPSMLGQVRLAGDSSRRPFWGQDEDEGRVYCDPGTDPNCPLPLVSLEGRREATMETPPMDKCNPAWDPGCPRPQPNMTLSPYVPSSYLRGGQIMYQGAGVRTRPKDRSGRRLYV
jgi:hypothetical protein